MLLKVCRVVFLLCLLNACTAKKDTLFTLLPPEETGINFRNQFFEDGPLNVANYIYFYNGGGVAIGDINADGLQDVLFTGNMVKNRLFLNKGNFKFEDITARSGIAEKQGWCTGATMADVNGDGKLDIYICRSADINPGMRQNLLFINNGDLTFSEKAADYGLNNTGYSTQYAFFDYDKDGDLDCFIINHSLQKYTAGVQDNPGLRNERNPDYASKLYQNNGGKFTDVSEAAGITSNVLTFGLGIATTDYNGDGRKDILLAGNNSWTRIKFGRYTANHGVLLQANTKGGYDYVPQHISGLKIRGNVRSLKTIRHTSGNVLLAGVNDQPMLMISTNQQTVAKK